jgi:hypothetical protein
MQKMKTPTFDSDGYPSDETLNYIAYWYTHNGWTPKEFLQFCEEAFNKHYGSWTVIEHYSSDFFNDKPFTSLRIATGGWSGNESLVSQMEKTIFWSVLWRASACGGLYILDLSKLPNN